MSEQPVSTPSSSKPPVVSHGRGGTANIGPDSTPYVDAGIVREGPEGDQGDGAYSAGRGGAGNIGSPNIKPKTVGTGDREMIPEVSIQPSMDDRNYHTGRGGEGNVQINKPKEPKHDGLADKLKNKMFASFGRGKGKDSN